MAEEKEELNSQLSSMKEHHVSLQQETRQMEQELEATKTELRTRYVGRVRCVPGCVRRHGRVLKAPRDTQPHTHPFLSCMHTLYVHIACVCTCIHSHAHMSTHPHLLYVRTLPPFSTAKELPCQYAHPQQHAPWPCPAHVRAGKAQVHHGGDTGHECELRAVWSWPAASAVPSSVRSSEAVTLSLLTEKTLW